MKKIWIMFFLKLTKAPINIKETQQHKQISTTNQVEDRTNIQFAQNIANHKEYELTASRHRKNDKKLKLAMLKKQVSRLPFYTVREFHEKIMENQNCIENAFTELREIYYWLDELMHIDTGWNDNISPREKRYQKEAFDYLKKFPVQERQAMMRPWINPIEIYLEDFEFGQPPKGEFILI